jgi:hypothetical protein
MCVQSCGARGQNGKSAEADGAYLPARFKHSMLKAGEIPSEKLCAKPGKNLCLAGFAGARIACCQKVAITTTKRFRAEVAGLLRQRMLFYVVACARPLIVTELVKWGAELCVLSPGYLSGAPFS